MKKPAGSKRTLSQRRRRRLVYYRIPFLENIFLPQLESKQAALFSRVVLSLQRRGYWIKRSRFNVDYGGSRLLTRCLSLRRSRRTPASLAHHHFCDRAQFYGERITKIIIVVLSSFQMADLWAGEEVVCYSFDSERAANNLPANALLCLCPPW